MRVIVLMTDFGLRDPYVGMMKGVIASINPNVSILDLTHEVPKYNIEIAAHMLKISYKYFPRGSIFTVVVDPGVGGPRRPIIIKSRNYYFVGPDNGVLVPAAMDDGVQGVYEINVGIAGLKEVSYTFHGRDVFAPTSAYLSLGIPPQVLGREIRFEELVTVRTLPEKPIVENDVIKVRVVHVDDFGNLILSCDLGTLMDMLKVSYGDYVRIRTAEGIRDVLVARTFSETCKGCLALYEGSFRLAEIAVYMGSAQKVLGLSVNDFVEFKVR